MQELSSWKVKHMLLDIVETEFQENRTEPIETAFHAFHVDNAHENAHVKSAHGVKSARDDENVKTAPQKTVTYWTAKNFLESLSWHVDEATFDAKLGGFVALPRTVVFEALGTMEVCKSIARTVLTDDAALATVIGYTENNRALMSSHIAHIETNDDGK